MFERILPERPTPERCIEAYYLQGTRFESIAERKLRRRQLTEDGNVGSAGGTCANPSAGDCAAGRGSVSNRLGFRMPGWRERWTRSEGAGVRKPPKNEPAGSR